MTVYICQKKGKKSAKVLPRRYVIVKGNYWTVTRENSKKRNVIHVII